MPADGDLEWAFRRFVLTAVDRTSEHAMPPDGTHLTMAFKRFRHPAAAAHGLQYMYAVWDGHDDRILFGCKAGTAVGTAVGTAGGMAGAILTHLGEGRWDLTDFHSADRTPGWKSVIAHIARIHELCPDLIAHVSLVPRCLPPEIMDFFAGSNLFTLVM